MEKKIEMSRGKARKSFGRSNNWKRGCAFQEVFFHQIWYFSFVGGCWKTITWEILSNFEDWTWKKNRFLGNKICYCLLENSSGFVQTTVTASILKLKIYSMDFKSGEKYTTKYYFDVFARHYTILYTRCLHICNLQHYKNILLISKFYFWKSVFSGFLRGLYFL